MKEALKKLWAGIGKKVAVAAVGLVVAALKAQHPDWPLPSEDLTRDIVLALLGCHTLTDVVAILRVAGLEYAKEKKS